MLKHVMVAAYVLLAGQAIAAETSAQQLLAHCAKSEEKAPRYDIPYQKALEAFVISTATSVALKKHEVEEPDIYPEFTKRYRVLAKPEYERFIKAEVAYRDQEAQKAISEYMAHMKLSEDDFKDLLQCAVITAFGNPNGSDSYGPLVLNHLDTLISGANMRMDSEAQAARAHQYTEQLAADEKAAQLKAQTQAKREQAQRENPSSNTMKTLSFQVTANSCVAASKVGTSSSLLEPKAQPDSKFLILDATFKNISESSRLIEPGVLLVKSGGKTYRFSSYELIPHEDYVMPISGVNPLVSYRMKFVYRIPNSLSGKVVWQPGGNPSQMTVSCGTI
ncbi:hypothetical protein ACYPKM_04260 [Pseudomonas aeruginosa]